MTGYHLFGQGNTCFRCISNEQFYDFHQYNPLSEGKEKKKADERATLSHLRIWSIHIDGFQGEPFLMTDQQLVEMFIILVTFAIII